MTGARIGRWTVLERAGRRGDNGQALWLCRCDCGSTRVHSGSNLRRGRTLSCGCAQAPDLTAPSRYKTVHNRIYRARGPARDHACVMCGEAAEEWSYDHNEASGEQEEAVKGDRGHVSVLRFHSNPAFYSPRCRHCHNAQRKTVARRDPLTGLRFGRLAREERRKHA